MGRGLSTASVASGRDIGLVWSLRRPMLVLVCRRRRSVASESSASAAIVELYDERAQWLKKRETCRGHISGQL